MKKTIFIVTLLAIFVNAAYGQLGMNSSGEVGVGAVPTTGIDFYTPEAKVTNLGINVTPSSSKELWVQGTAKFGHSGAMASFEFQYASFLDMKLVPTSNNMCTIGTSSLGIKAVTSYAFNTLSDQRQKENIRDLSGALDQIIKLQGVKYDLKKEYAYDETKITDESLKSKLDLERKDFIGFLAQDVFEVIPEAVSYDEDADVFSMNYLRIIPILVEAIKEQQTQIEDLKQTLASSNSTLKSASMTNTSINEAIEEMEITSLFQNRPNPFSVETTISYFLAESTNSASLFVYDMTGKQLKSFDLGQKGSGEVVISGGELDAGIYMYSLVVDGQIAGTKQS
jgi:hypothetical protein